MRSRRPRLALPLAALAPVLLLASSLRADVDGCLASKLTALGRAVRARARCEARIHLDPDPGPYCAGVLERATRRLARAFSRADGAGPCPGTADTLRPIAYADCIHYVGTDGPCAARVVTAAGKRVARVLACQARGVRRGEPASADCLAAADRRLVRALAAADRAEPCSGGPDHVAPFGDRCVGLMTDGLRCGNGVIDPGEECDGQPYCRTPLCQVEVTVCCDFGGICASGPVEYAGKCEFFGGTLSLGECVPSGAPCPIPESSCIPGACVDPPLPPHAVCCQQGTGVCTETIVDSQGREALALHECAQQGGQPFVAVCDPTGVCTQTVPD